MPNENDDIDDDNVAVAMKKFYSQLSWSVKIQPTGVKIVNRCVFL